MKALLVYSGGMDSTVLLHALKDDIKLAISFDYGSNHNDKEFACAEVNAKKLGIELRRIDIKTVMKGMKSSLLSGADAIPEGHYAADNMASTVVPFRNGIMLSIAAGIAESEGLNTLLLASHAGDHAQYPDCRVDFNNAIKQAIFVGTDYKVNVDAPFAKMDKRQIAELGNKVGVDFKDTWSCYKADSDEHCGKCGTCVERVWALRGFDPTEYLDDSYAVAELIKTGEWPDELK